MPRAQSDLPFADAEGTNAEEKNLLAVALLRCRGDLRLCQLMLWVFNTRQLGPLRKTNEQLAAAPWGLCCHANTAGATVRQAERLGMLIVRETWTPHGTRAPNELHYHRPGLLKLLAVDPGRTARDLLTPADDGGTPADDGGTPADDGGTPLDRCHIQRNNTSPFTSSESESERKKEARKLSLNRTDQSAMPRMAADEKIQEEDFLWDVPELAEARARRIAPLPPLDLAYGAFEPLKESHLASGSLVAWFRRQLSLREPVLGASEAELLLVLAAGLACDRIPAAEVQKSRVAIFSATVKRRLWKKILRQIPAARKLLDTVAARWPECLTHADGIGPEVQVASTEAVP